MTGKWMALLRFFNLLYSHRLRQGGEDKLR
jgi:hypothetical protein